MKKRKAWFLNSVSDRSHIVHGSPGGGERLTKPGGEVLTVSELVRMTLRGQDISVYRRPAIYTQGDDDDHDSASLHSFSALDFSEQAEAADLHRQRLEDLRKEIDRTVTPVPPPGEAIGDEGTDNPPDPKSRGTKPPVVKGKERATAPERVAVESDEG